VPTTAYLMVRAVVADPADRPGFDRWYEAEHLPQAAVAFAARRAWRCWSLTDPSVHVAFYEFPDAARVRAVLDSPELRALIAEFDRAWGARVQRSREVLEVAGKGAGAVHGGP
jgi:hypothetical protein